MPSRTRARRPATREIRDRRRNPRVDLLSELYGSVVALDLPVLVRNASRGGFLLETAARFPVGTEQAFRFRTRAGSTTVRAVCRHVQRITTRAGERRYAAGFQFLPQPAANLRLVLAAIAEATAEHPVRSVEPAVEPVTPRARPIPASPRARTGGRGRS